MILFSFCLLYFATFLLSLIFNIRPPSKLAFCGLMGFVGRRPVDITKWKWLFVENESRGRDSVGAYGGGNRFRAVGPPKQNLNNPELFKVLRGSHIVIGHTRNGTMGSTSIQNAHPFRIDNGDRYYIGAHNGFLLDEIYNLDTLSKLGIDEKPDVDSLAIFKALANSNGNFDVLKDLEGAMALSVVIGDINDKSKEKLYLYRRKSRPLFIGEAPDGIYYSSIEDSLKFIGCQKIMDLPTDTLFVFENGVLIDSHPVEKPSLTLSLGATRFSWKTGMRYDEYKHIVKQVKATEVEYDTYDKSNWGGFGSEDYTLSNRQKRIGFRQNVTAANNNTLSLKDRIDGLINDINNMSKFYNKTIPLRFGTAESFEKDDISSGIVVITLKGKTAKEAKDCGNLQAWAVYDDKIPTINGFTGPMGTTALKFHQNHCEAERIIRISHPLSPKVPTYTIKITPRAGRIMEVVLDIPFREEDGVKKGDKSQENNRHNKSDVGFSISNRHLLPAGQCEGGDTDGSGGDTGKKLSIGTKVHKGSSTKQNTADVSKSAQLVEDLIENYYHVNYHPTEEQLKSAKSNFFYSVVYSDLEVSDLAKNNVIDVKQIMEHALLLRIVCEEKYPTLVIPYYIIIAAMLKKISFYYFYVNKKDIAANVRKKEIEELLAVIQNEEPPSETKKKLYFIT